MRWIKRWTHVRSPALVCQNFSTAPPTSRLNVAVVGSGRMGQLRIQGLQSSPQFNLVAVIDAFDNDTEGISPPRFPSLKAASDHLSDTPLDGVWIATPTPTHHDIIRECLELKQTHSSFPLVSIGVEKPVGMNLEETDTCYELCEANDIDLVCSFQRRFDPSYVRLKESHELSRRSIQSIHTVFRDHPMPPIEFLKTGGDPFHDLAVHDIDFVCDLLNEYPRQVTAFGTTKSRSLQEANVMDKASVWLEFETTGAVCTMDISRHSAYGYDQRIEVFYQDGSMAQVQNPAVDTYVEYGHQIANSTFVYSFPQRFVQAYALELQHWGNVMHQLERKKVTWNAARMATVISEACRLAAVHKSSVGLTYDKTKQVSPTSDPILECTYEFK